ncbi:putative tetratricopeptide-like helical domain superfamily [Helianthus annuus]|uniref:Putative pentatricopeptide repeat protein n=1 Tax=Helianthus annuus TaxID=4232 RepID=A0A251TQ87_HELAN|nr:putative tetratricopeptide-like helical domain superfamily [Helianthus annuus]KAJ0501825.1 putative tetratricopeptide-like helical domain superfamily [Helianthus annuus]KAJ0509746.1 putative tetratricopeptide-like helical domain superfamily [Helianthus annuus]KAJ0517752.1 putative tetratricopeptide-like helical domain superfamily [Helianthus annuus]KAJ0685769.1 putative tetratricopeptide-like helical domain superfamily [Helianthus annuus]
MPQWSSTGTLLSNVQPADTSPPSAVVPPCTGMFSFTAFRSGDSKKAVRMFYRMNSLDENLNIWPDAVSLCNILPAFAALRVSMQGKEVHGYAVRTNLVKDLFVGNAIVDMYAKCGLIDDAHKVFKRMEVKDVVSWNAMVTRLSQIGRFEDALALFEKMRGENIELDVVTWSAVIAGYAQRGYGYEALDVFGQMVVFGSSEKVKRIRLAWIFVLFTKKKGE